jgi:hypothetical protein
MKKMCYLLTVIGVLLYVVAAVLFGGTTMGEVLSDAGNAVFLFNILIILYVIWDKLEKSNNHN